MSGNAPIRPARGTPPQYDDAYFESNLHREHWFRNNVAKRARRWQAILRMLEPTPSDRILEIGCGAGEHTIALAPLTGTAVGVDMSLAGVTRAGKRARDQRVSGVSFVASNAATLPFAAESFDKVAAIDFVEHIDDALLVRTLREVRRVLVSNGRVAIYTPCLTHYVERMKEHGILLHQIAGHVAVRGPSAYRRLLAETGFHVRSCFFLPSDYPVFGRIDRALGALPWVGSWFHFRICLVGIRALRNC